MKTNLHLDPISLRLPIVKHRILLQFYKRQTNECFFGVQFDGRFIMHADSISRKSLGKWAGSDCERLPNVVKSCAQVSTWSTSTVQSIQPQRIFFVLFPWVGFCLMICMISIYIYRFSSIHHRSWMDFVSRLILLQDDIISELRHFLR